MGDQNSRKRFGDLLIYQNENGDTKIDTFFKAGEIWMTQKRLSELFQVSLKTVSEHISNIYKEKELEENATIRKYQVVQNEGTRKVKRQIKHYNLDVILAIGYRIRNHIGTHFRKWAANILDEYAIKGFALNDEKLKDPQSFGTEYFDELLLRISDIRSSEKSFYAKIKEIFATSIDYDYDCRQAKQFVHTVESKIQFSLDELDMIDRIASLYLDYAEFRAKRHDPMHMNDWEIKFDRFLRCDKSGVLENAEEIVAGLAEEMVEEENIDYDIQRDHNDGDLDELIKGVDLIKRNL